MRISRNQIQIFTLSIFFVLLGLTLVQSTENAVFTGQVVDVSQNPVAGVEIYVYDTTNTRRPADFISSPTGKNGEFKITLPPGTYWTVARLRHDKKQFGPLSPGDKHSGSPIEIDLLPGDDVEEEFIVADLEETSRLAVKFDTTFIRVEGILLSKEGEPVKDVYVFANRTPAQKKIPDYITAWTNSSGRYTFFLPEGTYYFASTRLFPPGEKIPDFQKVTIDSNTKNINIVIEK